MPKFTKIRHVAKTQETELKFQREDSDRGDEETTEQKSTAAPDPEFPKALGALLPFVLALCELPKEYATGMEVRSVSFRHTEGSWGAVVHATKEVDASTSPLNISTPFLRQSADGQTEGKGLIPPKMEEALKILIARADDFRRHRRAQGELPLDARREDAHDDAGEAPSDPDTGTTEAEPIAGEAKQGETPEAAVGKDEEGGEPEAGEIQGGPLDGLPVVEVRGQRIVLPFDPPSIRVGELEDALQDVYVATVLDALASIDRRATAGPIYATRRKWLERHTDLRDPIKNPGAVPIGVLGAAIVNLTPELIQRLRDIDQREEAGPIYEAVLDLVGHQAVAS